MLQAYREHIDERAAQGIPPKPLDAQQTADLVELIKNPPPVKKITCWNCSPSTCPRGSMKPPTSRLVSSPR